MNSRAVELLVAAVVSALASLGQTVGDINGLVTDASGGVVVGAAVTVTNPQTNVKRSTSTNLAEGLQFPGACSRAFTTLKSRRRAFAPKFAIASNCRYSRRLA